MCRARVRIESKITRAIRDLAPRFSLHTPRPIVTSLTTQIMTPLAGRTQGLRLSLRSGDRARFRPPKTKTTRI
jgi:hypothetical protein